MVFAKYSIMSNRTSLKQQLRYISHTPTPALVHVDGQHWSCSCVCRCFSFGIGEGASTALITGMAREGSGHAQFITGTDRMQPKVRPAVKNRLDPIRCLFSSLSSPSGDAVAQVCSPAGRG